MFCDNGMFFKYVFILEIYLEISYVLMRWKGKIKVDL